MHVQMRDYRVDGMRFGAMLAVILFHIGVVKWGNVVMFPDNLGDLWNYWRLTDWHVGYLIFVVGDQAVPLFIFISGYGLVVADKKPNLDWLVSRLKKVLVPFWLAFSLVPLLFWAWQWAPEFMQQQSVAQLPTWQRVVASAGLLQNFSTYTFNSPVPSWWFVPVIVQLYCLFPGLFYLLNRLSARSFLKYLVIFQGLWNVVVLLQMWMWKDLFWFWYSGFSYVLVFGLGMWVAKYGRLERIEKLRYVVIAWCLGIMTWLVGWSLRLLGQDLVLYSEAVIALGWFLSGWYGLEMLQRFFPQGVIFLAWMGRRLSYWVYLVHEPLLYAIGAWWWRR